MIPGSGRSPWRRARHPTPALLPGVPYGQRSLVCYSPCGHGESDTTERPLEASLSYPSPGHTWSQPHHTGSSRGSMQGLAPQPGTKPRPCTKRVES